MNILHNCSTTGKWLAAAILLTTFGAISLRTGLALQLVPQSCPLPLAPLGGGGDAGLPILSPDGRYVVFASNAANLVRASDNAPLTLAVPATVNVYLRDRASATTALVSANPDGKGGNGDSLPLAVSTNGQFVLFQSAADDLVANDTNNASDVFVRDVVNQTTLLVSVNTNGASGNDASRDAVMTPGGRFVAFVSDATDLVAGAGTKGRWLAANLRFEPFPFP